MGWHMINGRYCECMRRAYSCFKNLNISTAYQSIIHTNFLYMQKANISKKGHTSIRKERLKQIPPVRTSTYHCDNPRNFQDHPQKTVGVVFTRICYICISKYLKMVHNSVRKGRIKNPAFTHNYIPWVTILEGFKIIHWKL